MGGGIVRSERQGAAELSLRPTFVHQQVAGGATGVETVPPGMVSDGRIVTERLIQPQQAGGSLSGDEPRRRRCGASPQRSFRRTERVLPAPRARRRLRDVQVLAGTGGRQAQGPRVSERGDREAQADGGHDGPPPRVEDSNRHRSHEIRPGRPGRGQNSPTGSPSAI